MLCCCSVSQLYLTLCDPMNCSMPCFPCPSLSPGVRSNSCPLSQWCCLTISSCVAPFSCLQSFAASGSFPMSQLLASGGQSIGAFASASVLRMNFQGWFPLGLTGLIFLMSKGLSRVFSSTAIQKHHFFSAQSSVCPILTSIHDYWINHSFDYMDLCQQSVIINDIYINPTWFYKTMKWWCDIESTMKLLKTILLYCILL